MKKKEIEGAIINEMEKLSKGFKRFVFWQKIKAWTAYISLPLLLISIGVNVYLSVHFKNENNALINRAVTIYSQDIGKEREVSEKLQEAYNTLVNKYNAMSDSCEIDAKNAKQWEALFNKTRQYGNRHCYYIEANDMINCLSY